MNRVPKNCAGPKVPALRCHDANHSCAGTAHPRRPASRKHPTCRRARDLAVPASLRGAPALHALVVKWHPGCCVCAGDHPRFPRRKVARIPPPPAPLLREVWLYLSPGHASPAADVVRRCGQGLLPCRRGGLRGGLLWGPSVGGGSLFQRSCSGSEPPTLCLPRPTLFMHSVWTSSILHSLRACDSMLHLREWPVSVCVLGYTQRTAMYYTVWGRGAGPPSSTATCYDSMLCMGRGLLSTIPNEIAYACLRVCFRTVREGRWKLLGEGRGVSLVMLWYVPDVAWSLHTVCVCIVLCSFNYYGLTNSRSGSS
jgi:hypothetical protein